MIQIKLDIGKLLLNMGKYMHFNSSCSFCAVSYMLMPFGVETDDVSIALNIGLPYIFAYEDGHFIAGAMLQNSKWFNLFLNPIGLQLLETAIDKSQLIEHLDKHQNVMLGLKTDLGKHAVVFIQKRNDKYQFFNPHHKGSGEEDAIFLTDSELLGRINDIIIVGSIIKCEAKTQNVKIIFKQSLMNLDFYKDTIINFVDNNHEKDAYANSLDTLFRPLLLDVLSMMNIIHKEKLTDDMKMAQMQLLSFIRGKTTSFEKDLFKDRISNVIERYKELINQQIASL